MFRICNGHFSTGTVAWGYGARYLLGGSSARGRRPSVFVPAVPFGLPSPDTDLVLERRFLKFVGL